MVIPGEERHRILDTFSTALKVLEASLAQSPIIII
jgi:hypothetical protein